MNRQEAKILNEVAVLLRAVGSLPPRNPCDIAKLARGINLASATTKWLACALSDLIESDIEQAKDDLAAAKEAFSGRYLDGLPSQYEKEREEIQ